MRPAELIRRARDRLAGGAGGGAGVGPTARDMARVATGRLPPPFVELNEVLHFARTLALSDMPRGARTLVSAGAAGRWYFDWVNQAYGPVERHVGVEALSPRPDHLPDYAEWIPADVGAAGGVVGLDAGSADLLFSGQNLEHLWPEQVVAFLQWANRSLREDGWLVVDSPNARMTAAYGWTHPEHTVEIAPAEASELLATAGFSVETMKGLWLCQERDTLLPLDPPGAEDPLAVVRRVALAFSRPDDSFIWWAEARKVAPPDVESLERLARELFSTHWPERASRIRVRDAQVITSRDGRPAARMPKGVAGIAMYGPYMPLRAGTYDFEVEVELEGVVAPGAVSEDRAGRLEVVVREQVVGAAEFGIGPEGSGSRPVTCRVGLPGPCDAVQIRLFSYGTTDLLSPLALKVSAVGAPSSASR